MRFIFENLSSGQYYTARKYNCIVQVRLREDKKYWFEINNEKDDWAFNSFWENHPNPIVLLLLKELPTMEFESVGDALNFVEEWFDTNINKLRELKKKE
jgi:hypothetical protein